MRFPAPREEGPTEDGGSLYANPAHAGHASREGGPSESPFLPFPCPGSLARMLPRIMRPRARVARALSVLRILEKENAEIYK